MADTATSCPPDCGHDERRTVSPAMTEDRVPIPTGADVRASSGGVLPSSAPVGPIEALADSLVGILTNPPDGLHNARHVARRLRRWGYVLERVER